MDPSGENILTQDEARNIIILLWELSDTSEDFEVINSAVMASIRASMMEFIDLHGEGIPTDVFFRELHSHILTGLTTSNPHTLIDPGAESSDPRFQQYIPQTETAITDLVDAIPQYGVI
jgi:hypothetical protein